RSLAGWKTAYPRGSKMGTDPDNGLASIEALYLAYHLLGRPTEGLLAHYRWAAEFLAANGLPPGGATSLPPFRHSRRLGQRLLSVRRAGEGNAMREPDFEELLQDHGEVDYPSDEFRVWLRSRGVAEDETFLSGYAVPEQAAFVCSLWPALVAIDL